MKLELLFYSIGLEEIQLQSLLGFSLELHRSSGILWTPQHKENASDNLSVPKTTEMLH